MIRLAKLYTSGNSVVLALPKPLLYARKYQAGDTIRIDARKSDRIVLTRISSACGAPHSVERRRAERSAQSTVFGKGIRARRRKK